MAVFRAIEEGFNLVRHASGGLSMAADAKGRVLASMDHYTSKQRAMVSVVPTRGTRTLYSRAGDLFPIGCLIALAALVGGTLHHGNTSRKDASSVQQREEPN